MQARTCINYNYEVDDYEQWGVHMRSPIRFIIYYYILLNFWRRLSIQTFIHNLLPVKCLHGKWKIESYNIKHELKSVNYYRFRHIMAFCTAKSYKWMHINVSILIVSYNVYRIIRPDMNFSLMLCESQKYRKHLNLCCKCEANASDSHQKYFRKSHYDLY